MPTQFKSYYNHTTLHLQYSCVSNENGADEVEDLGIISQAVIENHVLCHFNPYHTVSCSLSAGNQAGYSNATVSNTIRTACAGLYFYDIISLHLGTWVYQYLLHIVLKCWVSAVTCQRVGCQLLVEKCQLSAVMCQKCLLSAVICVEVSKFCVSKGQVIYALYRLRFNCIILLCLLRF